MAEEPVKPKGRKSKAQLPQPSRHFRVGRSA